MCCVFHVNIITKLRNTLMHGQCMRVWVAFRWLETRSNGVGCCEENSEPPELSD
jgi:hypothetical protein